MEHHRHGMKRKWDRHYRNTRSSISVGMMLFGFFFLVPLAILWPQHYSSMIFDSRLIYHLMIDAEDYWTCNKNYVKFVVDEPTTDDALYSMYVFSVSNAPGVLQTGQKPAITETGPYGYRKRMYKYDVEFDPIDSNTVTFKEYTLLDPITEPEDFVACRRMFFATERDTTGQQDPCANGACDCRTHDKMLTVLNPLFLKLMWEERPEQIIARFAGEVFTNVKEMLGDEFVEAVKSFLVPYSYSEIGQFRQIVQVARVLKTGYDHMIANGNTTEDVVRMMVDVAGAKFIPPACGLSIYGINDCPFNGYFYFWTAYTGRPVEWNDLQWKDQPLPGPFLNASQSWSPLNFEEGMPRWAGVCNHVGELPFNSLFGFTMLTKAESEQMYYDLALNFTKVRFNGTATGITDTDVRRSKVTIIGMCKFMYTNWINRYAQKLVVMNQEQFRTISTAVPCAPSLKPCIWTWGYMQQYGGTNISITPAMSNEFIDVRTAVNTNPNSMYYPSNAQLFYNVQKFCTRVLRPGITNTECMDIEYARLNATFSVPAHLWAVDFGIDTVNMTRLYESYTIVNPTAASQAPWIEFACQTSTLQYDVYMTHTDYHDEYVIRYLNKFKDPLFVHNFTVGKWDELGYAQWGGGFVTYALGGVRTIYQFKRDGMFRYGIEDYFKQYIEYSMWSIYVGFPQTFIYDVDEARNLLDLLAAEDEDAIWLKDFIVKTGTTYHGKGEVVNNALFNVGEQTYITEANEGNFTCDVNNERNSFRACALLNTFYESSPSWCQEIEDNYLACVSAISNGNRWLTNCDTTQTSISSPTFGIQCDSFTVYGMSHPYRKSRGNVVFEMVYSLNTLLVMQNGLWCSSNTDCDFKWGGLFMTTKAQQVLFEGYTEASVLKYLHNKHRRHNISFSCIDAPYGQCNVKNYNCTVSGGVLMELPHGKSFTIAYTKTPKDQYFAPYFMVNMDDGEMLWPFAMDSNTSALAQAAISNDTYWASVLGREPRIVRVFNPFYTLYPSWHTTDVEFNKYYQCQKRMMGGLPGHFNDCSKVLATGRDETSKMMNLLKYLGNDTVSPYLDPTGVINVTGVTTTNHQHRGYFWDGFLEYPYSYKTRQTGPRFFSLLEPMIFNEQHALTLKLSQKTIINDWQKSISVSIPLIPPEERADPFSYSESHLVRRFVEDEDTWDELALGVPRDFFGMKYEIPKGMTSIERIAGVPAFVGTAHYYGNYKWQGKQYLEVIGANFIDDLGHRSFTDYDPITGQAFRTAIRQQVMLRVERGSMFPNIISSQDRCVVPTKAFGNIEGLGCYAYYPIIWWEDTRLINPEFFFSNTIHYYLRPDRFELLSTIGAVVGSLVFVAGLCLFIYEWYHRKKFQARIYVD